MKRGDTDRDRLTAAVRRARRRMIANRALWETALAASIALLGATLLLLLGSGLFGRPLVVLFALGGVATGAWRVWLNVPELYEVSQAVDARLRTEDQISTAIHFLPSEETIVVLQRRVAARLAEQLPLKSAFPLTFPRSLYGLGAAAMMALTLWMARYLLEKPFTLRQPLPHVVFQALLGDEPVVQQARDFEQAQEAHSRNTQVPAEGEEQFGNSEQAFDEQESADSASNSPAGPGEKRAGDDRGGSPEQQGENPEEAGDPMDSSSGDNAQGGITQDAKATPQKAQSGQNSESPTNSGSNGQDGASENLLSRLGNSMKDLLSRLQPSRAAGGQRRSQSPSSQQNPKGPNEGNTEGTEPQSSGQQMSEAQGGNSDSQQVQSSQADKGNRSAERNTSNEPGNEEGDKRIAEVQQQQKAMGQLSELYGRRSAALTGAVMLESKSGKQVLSTPELHRKGRHFDTGGVVSRDEIPLAYQAFVKNYFEKLRQSAKRTQNAP